MSNLRKLYEKAKASPNNLSFTELCFLAEKAGFVLRKKSGTSHRIYRHNNIHDPSDLRACLFNAQSDNGKAKPYQVKQLLDKIEIYQLPLDS